VAKYSRKAVSDFLDKFPERISEYLFPSWINSEQLKTRRKNGKRIKERCNSGFLINEIDLEIIKEVLCNQTELEASKKQW
jgi:hypothetical protein